MTVLPKRHTTPRCRSIAEALSRWKGHVGDFAQQLNDDGIPYLSYSKVACVEACEYRYFLEYVEGVEVEEPRHFTKGHAFHEVASLAYRQFTLGRDGYKAIQRKIKKHPDRRDRTHLLNAARLLIDNPHQGYNVVASDLPFVLSLGNRLPPLLGEIDLLLRKGQTFLVVDHKTGKAFRKQDGLQLQIYREHARRAYKPARCLACFDEYRWVESLDTIRKPAFRRTHVKPKPWPLSLKRIVAAHEIIRRIEKAGHAASDGECFACHLKDACPQATYTSYW